MISFTLFRYLAWRLIASVGGLFIAFTTLIMVIDLIENLRFAGKYANGSFVFALQITALRALSLTQVLSPFLFLFGALWCFTQLNRRSEISVMRSAGISVWSLLTPPAIVSVLSGLFLISVIDPLSANMMAQSEKMKNDIRGKRTSFVQFFNDGLWLRQRDESNAFIINAKSIDQERGIIGQPTIWRFDNQSRFVERVDAPQGTFRENQLELENASVRRPGSAFVRTELKHTIPTGLTVDDLDEQVAKPETISMWQLRRFIRLAETAGLSTNQYFLRFHDLLSTPLKLLGMVLIAATFSMRPIRQGGMLRLVLVSIGAGFFLYIATAVSTALGESGTVSLIMAAWAPAVIATLLAVTGILHLEDG